MSSDRKCLLILGMHRSGTSAIAKVCNLMGVYFGHQFIPPDEYNAKGYFEDIRITKLHEQILNSLGVGWDFPGLLPDHWLEAETTHALREQLQAIILSLSQGQSLWGVKDPRLSRLLPVWRPLFDTLGCLPYCIIMVRSPLEVAASLARRDQLTFDQSIALWLAHSLEVERFSRPYRRVFIHYDDLLADPQRCLTRLTDGFGHIWPRSYASVADDISEFLDPELRHYRVNPTNLIGDSVPRTVAALYNLLLRESSGEAVDPTLYEELYDNWIKHVGCFTQAKHWELMRISEWASGLKQDLARVQDDNRQLQEGFEAKHQELMHISDWASGLKQDLARVQDDNRQLRQQYSEKHQELMRISDWASGLKQDLARVQDDNRQLQGQFEAKHQELMRISDWASGLKQDLARAREETQDWMDRQEAKHAELMKMSDWASGLKQDLAGTQQEVRDWTDRHEAKHAELMKMSDWAYGMKLRLEAIDRSYLMRLAKPMMALEYRARDGVNRLLAHPMVLRWRHRQQYRRNIANFPQLRQSVATNQGRLIVVFPIITWEFRHQRPQHIVAGLVGQGFTALYLAMTLAGKGKPYQTVAEAGADLGFNVIAEHIHQIWLHSKNALNIYTDPVQGEDLCNLELGLSAAIQAVRASKIYYLVQFPGWAPLALALREKFGGSLLFDCMDDHSGFSTNTEQALQTEEMLVRKADLTIASSCLLEEKLKAQNPNTILVKNGTEFAHFAHPQANGTLEHLRGQPIIGYYGAISDWFDLELVIYCARRRPAWHFVLIGSTFGCDTESARSLSNVSFLGEKPYAELPGYLAYFDVCTIPFKLLPLTMATNPVKFYEYLSSGKPVVAVDLPELRPYREDCYIARSPEDFLQQLENALAHKEDPDLVARRVALARENSWSQRVATILRHPVFGMG